MDQMPENVLHDLNRKTENKDSSVSAVHTEVSTTKAPDQKVELSKELFPPVKTKRQMRTRRVIH